MTAFDTLLEKHAHHVGLRDRVLRCPIATGAAGNSLDAGRMTSATELLQAVAQGETNAVGAVLVHSEGANFCTGGDVKAFGSAEDPGAFVTELASTFHEFILAVTGAPVPVVAAVSGWAAGAGMSIALACDIVVGGPGTRFRPAYPSIGFSPDGGMSWTLPRIIGPTRARDLLLTDGVLDGEEAGRLGVLSRLVADDKVLAEAEEIAGGLAKGPTGSLGRIKRLAWESTGRDLAAHLAHEARSIGECAASPAGREGVRAFAERRPADYSGSW
ncbi:enoyl-CoA hydratase/isomerase family protein [Amycolatopsis sp.]|uniref:enoyl-CoA hydratase/isomerase family protein n=1 Tax=Amycolatopsis sp. TaxID=37632 RepID=UPI002B65586C|nr:enoyl-CoA hydratase-related protein [Amycolatopsis sp.]HVV12210.1 enoyl-CoA hydratase-related protein [Amycolatopsis sp.]